MACVDVAHLMTEQGGQLSLVVQVGEDAACDAHRTARKSVGVDMVGIENPVGVGHIWPVSQGLQSTPHFADVAVASLVLYRAQILRKLVRRYLRVHLSLLCFTHADHNRLTGDGRLGAALQTAAAQADAADAQQPEGIPSPQAVGLESAGQGFKTQKRCVLHAVQSVGVVVRNRNKHMVRKTAATDLSLIQAGRCPGMLSAMNLLLDSLWRAVAYCMHPRVIALSFLPLLLMVAVSFGLGYFFWDATVAAVADWLQARELVQALLGWLDHLGLSSLRTVFAPLLVLVLVTPVIVLLCLLLVALFMTPAMVDLVAQRRFADLEQKRGGSLIISVLWSLGSTFLALLVLVVSIPLWLVPPLVLIVPPLIWGWLTYRVFAFDALALHASAAERQQILRQHRSSLLTMGVLSGYLGAAPSLLWASGAMFIALAPLLVPLAVWIYTLVFAFASLWFSHFTLSALQRLRALEAAVPPAPGAVIFPAPSIASSVEPLSVSQLPPPT